MNRLFSLGALLLAACANDNGTPRTFANNDLQLAVGNGARMGCSCLFVMQMSEDYCRAWIKASPDVAKVSIDTVKKTVESSAAISISAKAHYVDAKRGCVLE
jgi:hypothetical protein